MAGNLNLLTDFTASGADAALLTTPPNTLSSNQIHGETIQSYGHDVYLQSNHTIAGNVFDVNYIFQDFQYLDNKSSAPSLNIQSTSSLAKVFVAVFNWVGIGTSRARIQSNDASGNLASVGIDYNLSTGASYKMRMFSNASAVFLELYSGLNNSVLVFSDSFANPLNPADIHVIRLNAGIVNPLHGTDVNIWTESDFNQSYPPFYITPPFKPFLSNINRYL